MKTSRRLAGLFLAIVMMFTLAVSVSAIDGGSITIDNAVKDQTYTIYEILYLESYNKDSGAYSYKAKADWNVFINGADIKNVYVNVDDQGYVTWKDNADPAAFAKLAQKYAIDHRIVNQGSMKAENATVTFTNLELGYYLVDTTLGTLCSLDTTTPSVTIKEKNAEPTNVKTVEEDSTGNYGSTNDADIGQTVNFKSTITAQAGAENYVFHDKMSAGLTYTGVTGVTLNGENVDKASYTVKTTEFSDDCTFEVIFTQAFCNTLKANDEIVISYTATVNEKAVIGSTGNPNESKIEYGESGKITTTPPSKTTTYTWSFDVLKYGNNDESKVLKDAQFVLLNNGKTKVATIVNGKLTGWVDVPTAGEDRTITWPANTVLTTGADGKIAIAGLDSDTYYLREVEAPDGYNKLAEDKEVKIAPTAGENNTLSLAPLTVKVNNQSGAELPSTGGIGTTIFYIIGAVLVLGASVLLVTKRRMKNDR